MKKEQEFALALYKKHQYDLFLKNAEDSDRMDPKWVIWNESKEEGKKNLRKLGIKVKEVEVDFYEFCEYINENKLKNNGESRAGFAAFLAFSNKAK
ncbi:MAG: hypothetical protein IIA45_00760 [Bacteroidetes bacterium]|nr:hypothetical protein [Bacteroidota bacterium]